MKSYSVVASVDRSYSLVLYSFLVIINVTLIEANEPLLKFASYVIVALECSLKHHKDNDNGR